MNPDFPAEPLVPVAAAIGDTSDLSPSGCAANFGLLA
jgi:hypothetical protein